MPNEPVALPASLRPMLDDLRVAYDSWRQGRDPDDFFTDAEDLEERLTVAAGGFVDDALATGVEPVALANALVSSFPEAVSAGLIDVRSLMADDPDAAASLWAALPPTPPSLPRGFAPAPPYPSYPAYAPPFPAPGAPPASPYPPAPPAPPVVVPVVFAPPVEPPQYTFRDTSPSDPREMRLYADHLTYHFRVGSSEGFYVVPYRSIDHIEVGPAGGGMRLIAKAGALDLSASGDESEMRSLADRLATLIR